MANLLPLYKALGCKTSMLDIEFKLGSPTTRIKDVDNLETIQRRATRMMEEL